jgi:hypothetical protein
MPASAPAATERDKYQKERGNKRIKHKRKDQRKNRHFRIHYHTHAIHYC